MTDPKYLAKKEQYLLKAVYVRRKLRTDGYYGLMDEMNSILEAQGALLDWEKRQDWGITDAAWEIACKSDVDPLFVFCHPKILNQHPTSLLYYRCISLLPKKGFKAIIKCDPEPYELGKKEPGSLSKVELTRIVNGVNEVISNTLEQGSFVTMTEITGMYFAQAGMTLDGSWKNKIGEEGQLLIWNLIARELYSFGDIASLTRKDRRGDIPLDEIGEVDLLNNWQDYRCLNLVNGTSVLYSSEPDIILQSSSGDCLGAVEIKAGLDPAGALERTGAVLKSFESVLDEYPNAETILITSCETEESKRRLNESRAVHCTYYTADLTTTPSQQRKLITRIRKSLGLVE